MSKISSKKKISTLTIEIVRSSGEIVNMFAHDKRGNLHNFAYSFRPVYYVSRAFGLMPYTIIYDTNGEPIKPKITARDSLWMTISVFIYLTLGYSAYQNMALPENRSTTSYILILGDSVLLILSLVFGGQLIIMDFFNRFKLVDVVKKITAFDVEVSHQSNMIFLF